MRASRTGSKTELREAAIRYRGELTREKLLELSDRVTKNVMSSKEYRNSKTIATYVAKNDELETSGIIRHSLAMGKRVLVPVTQTRKNDLTFSELRDYESELAPGHFGVLEPKVRYIRPVPLREAELVLVPLVAWDDKGHRLGYGKGYFDSALSTIGFATMTMGLGFESQRIPNIPQETHDVGLRAVATERRIVYFEGKGIE